jgi:predicted PurR-regulated permease PerM
MLGGVTGGLSLIGYWLIGLPYALVLALIAALLEVVPFLGAILSTGLAVGVGLSVSFELGLLALATGVIIQQLESNVLAPRIMAHAVGVSPVVTLLAFVGFVALLGPVGGFVAVPLAATLQLLLAAWADRESLSEAPGERRDQAAHLRYQIADLTQDLTRRLRERPDADAAPMDDPEEQIEAVLAELQALLDRSEEAAQP